jgi:hypothetical protein
MAWRTGLTGQERDAMEACPRDIDEALAFLRSHGFSKVMSIAALTQLFGLKLDEAKQRVHLSPTWADVRERDDAFHDELVRGVTSDGESA